MTAILDLNDIALRLWHQEDCVHSPGYALYDGNQYHFGHPALKTSRKTPRAVHTRFWSQLNTQSLAPALGPARHTADLAHSHLQALHNAAGAPRRVLIAAPGSMNREQLALLLGIIQHLPFDIAGLVHRTAALGAASGLHEGQHVELQLHQIVVTPFQADDGHIQALESQTLPGAGLLALQDQLATTLSSLFVNQTRFDPLRSATAEQALYDAMPRLLDDLQASGEAQLAIEGYSARVTREDLAQIGERLCDQLKPLLGRDWPVLLEYPLSQLPGLALEQSTHAIASDALAGLITEHLPVLEQSPDSLMLCRRVPRSTKATASAPMLAEQDEAIVELAEPAPRPTHLLQGFSATRLHHETTIDTGAVLRFDGDALTLTGTIAPDLLVNGKAATPGQVLSPGDVLSDSLGFSGQLILVED